MSEIETKLRERMLAQPLVARCALCSWSMSGTAGEVLQAQLEHRRDVHRITRKPRFSRHLSSFRSPSLTVDEKLSINAEVEKRRKLNGLEEAA